MDEIVNLCLVLGDQIDTPKTASVSKFSTQKQISNLPGIAVRSGETHEAVCEVVGIDEGAESASKIW